MLTFTKTTVTEEPRLVIKYDQWTESPRQDTCLGYFYTKERDYNSPDGKDSDIYNIMVATAEEADNTADHMRLMTKRINEETDEKVLAIYPVNRYEHGDIEYSIGVIHNFDNSNCGFYIVTDKTMKEIGAVAEGMVECVKNELKTYSNWANGNVYMFTLYDEQGEEVDQCGGLYDIDDVKQFLPEEWKDEDMQDYFKN